LHLETGTAAGLAGFAAAMFVIVAWLPETKSWWNIGLHVLLTFHFTVLSRVFFRSDDLDTSRSMIAGLLRFDTHGVRPGLMSPLAWTLLIGGIAYHMTPKRWVEQVGFGVFRQLPGPVIGILFATAALAVHVLLSGGPRANIYFQF
jgi:alginate O-acetyltransferase complex protein AlgI